MNPFRSLRDYEDFVYALPERHASILRHHRIPAPGLSFERPNLAFLIEEIERELLQRIGD